MKNNIHSFLSEVKEQIKSKEAKEYVTEELTHHIKEATKVWIKKGFNEVEAEEKAVEQMGNPTTVGRQLNKLHRPKIDWVIVILVTIILGLGFLPLLSTDYMNTGQLAINKIIFTFLGGAAILVLTYIDYRKMEKLGWLFYIIGVCFLLTLVLFSNKTVYGIPTLEIGPITIESLMAVPFFFLAWASLFNNKSLRIWHFGSLFLLSCYLFLSTTSISTTYIYSVMVFIMLWWSKFSRKSILAVLTVTVSSVMVLGAISWAFTETYQKARLLEFIYPKEYPNFTMLKINELMTKSGWLGSSMNQDVIPDAHTNFVLVSFIYSYGWILASAIVFILALFIVRIIVISKKINDSYGKLLLIGVIALTTVQFVSNIGMSFGFFPLMPMSFPFVSYGLMPILLNAFLVGVVLSVYRRKDITSVGMGRALK